MGGIVNSMATTHVLVQHGTDNVFFARFVVNGDEVEVTRYCDSDLMSEKTYTREEARNVWNDLVRAGWKTESA